MSSSKPGIVFGFLTQGLTDVGNACYRFGRTTKTMPQNAKPTEFLHTLFAGLNRPRQVILFKVVPDVTKSWDELLETLRIHAPFWRRESKLKITQLVWLGDRYFGATCSTAELELELKKFVPNL